MTTTPKNKISTMKARKKYNVQVSSSAVPKQGAHHVESSDVTVCLTYIFWAKWVRSALCDSVIARQAGKQAQAFRERPSHQKHVTLSATVTRIWLHHSGCSGLCVCSSVDGYQCCQSKKEVQCQGILLRLCLIIILLFSADQP